MKKYKPIVDYTPTRAVSKDEGLFRSIIWIGFLGFAVLLAYSIWSFNSADTGYTSVSQRVGHLSDWIRLYNVLKFGGLLGVLEYWRTAKLTQNYHWAIWMRIFLPYESAWREYVEHFDRPQIKRRNRATYIYLAFVIVLNLVMRFQVSLLQKDISSDMQESHQKIEELSKIMKKR